MAARSKRPGPTVAAPLRRFPKLTMATRAEPTAPPSGGLLERRFRLTERGTDVRTEALGGLTTFATMAYIIFVNPAILSAAGMPFGAVAVATALAAALFSIVMGLYANVPFALDRKSVV